MPPPQQAGRNNLLELKAKLSKILGPDKESQYFSIFSKFLSHRLSKSELDRQVVLTIGKENIALHNQIVKAILYNAACSEAPMPPPPAATTTTTTNTSKPIKGISRKPLRNHDDAPLLPHPVAARSNGERKRLVRKPKDRQSLLQQSQQQQQQVQLQQLVKEEASTSQGDAEDLGRPGTSSSRGEIDLLRPVQRFQGAAEQPDADSRVLLALKRPRLILPGQQDETKAGLRTSPSVSNNEEAVEDPDCTLWQASPVRAPLGIPLCVASIGSARRAATLLRKAGGAFTHSLLGDSIDEDCLEATDLPDNDAMQRRMEEIAVVDEGLQGVSADCAPVLNQALDLYLKRLISASVGLVQSRRRKDEPQQQQQQQQQQVLLQQQHGVNSSSSIELLLKDGILSTAAAAGTKLPHANGIWLNHHHLQQQQQQQQQLLQQQHHQQQQQQHQQAGECHAKQKQQQASISVLDFKVAMDASPQLLGENRPLHMERIMLRVFEQQDGPVLQ